MFLFNRENMKGFFTFIFSLILLSGCASSPDFENPHSVDDVYDRVHEKGQKDTVTLLRRAFIVNKQLGQSDPFIPLRKPELVVPVFVVPYTKKKSNERVGGHWKYLVIEEAQWAE